MASALTLALVGTAACGTGGNATAGGSAANGLPAASSGSPTSSSAATTATTANLPTVNIGYEDAPDPEMVAIAQKYFAQYMHAHVNMKYFSSGPNALAALASGSLQFMTVLGNPPLAIAIAKGVPLQVVWAQDLYTTGEGLVVKASSGISSLKGLEGKTVALAQGSSSSFELGVAEQQAGVPASKIKIDNMSPPAMVAAWQKGAIQAAYVWVPFFSEMQSDGGKVLVYDKTQGSAAPIFNLAVVNTAWAKTHASMVQGFVQAEAAGVTFYQQNPTQAYADMAQVGKITAAAAKSQAAGLKFLTLQEQVSQSGLGTPGNTANSLVTKSLQEAAAWLKSSGTLTSVPSDFGSYVNPTYAEAVYKAQSGSTAS